MTNMVRLLALLALVCCVASQQQLNTPDDPAFAVTQNIALNYFGTGCASKIPHSLEWYPTGTVEEHPNVTDGNLRFTFASDPGRLSHLIKQNTDIVSFSFELGVGRTFANIRYKTVGNETSLKEHSITWTKPLFYGMNYKLSFRLFVEYPDYTFHVVWIDVATNQEEVMYRFEPPTTVRIPPFPSHFNIEGRWGITDFIVKYFCFA